MNNDTILNNRYRLVQQQGSGGMAVIYKATDLLLGRTVAIKILRPTLGTDPAFLARFRNEARNVANFTHPNIVTVHDVGSEGTTQYIVMEFVEGQDLKKIIKTAAGPLPVERALHLAIQISQGVGFAHRTGFVHADVKPQNILVTPDDTVKVTDFGIAQAFSTGDPNEKQSVVWGSPHYFAPEQARGEKPTPASDVYAIGIVLFEMLTGRLPYTGQSQQDLALAHLRERVPLVTEFNPNINPNLAQIIFKTMSKRPTDRWQNAEQLASILIKHRDAERQIAINIVQAPPNVNPPPVSWGGASAPLPQGVDRLPTQRVDLAPNPPSPNYQGQGGYAPAGQSALYPNAYNVPQGASANMQGAVPPQAYGNSGYSQPLYDAQRQDVPQTMDLVTLALAVLAFFAVACLIPLYIAVFQASFGG